MTVDYRDIIEIRNAINHRFEKDKQDKTFGILNNHGRNNYIMMINNTLNGDYKQGTRSEIRMVSNLQIFYYAWEKKPILTYLPTIK